MDGLIWSAGVLLVGVVSVTVYTVLRLKTAERWLREAAEKAPAKKIANMEAFVSAVRSEFSTLCEQVDEKHDRWMREQASLRTYIYRRLGKEPKADDATDETIPDRISAYDARLAVPRAGEEASRAEGRRRLRDAYYAARGKPS